MPEEPRHTRVKLVGALLLLLSLAFPISTCSHYEDTEGGRVEVATGESPPEGVRRVTEDNYVLEVFHPWDPGTWMSLFGFLWPLMAVAVLALREKGTLVKAVRILEPFLIAGSICLVEFLSTFLGADRALGAYVAFLALGVYALATISDDVTLYRQWKRQRT